MSRGNRAPTFRHETITFQFGVAAWGYTASPSISSPRPATTSWRSLACYLFRSKKIRYGKGFRGGGKRSGSLATLAVGRGGLPRWIPARLQLGKFASDRSSYTRLVTSWHFWEEWLSARAQGDFLFHECRFRSHPLRIPHNGAGRNYFSRDDGYPNALKPTQITFARHSRSEGTRRRNLPASVCRG